jgi:hypothetical protein
MCRVKAHLEKEADAATVTQFQKGVTAFMKDMLKNFKDYEPHIGESYDENGQMPLLYWVDENNSSTPYMYYFKHGLLEEKVVGVLSVHSSNLQVHL